MKPLVAMGISIQIVIDTVSKQIEGVFAELKYIYINLREKV